MTIVQFVQGFTEEEGKERAMKIFETLDKNGDGSLVEDEFIKVYYYFTAWKYSVFLSVYLYLRGTNLVVFYCPQGCLLDHQLLEMLNGSPTSVQPAADGEIGPESK